MELSCAEEASVRRSAGNIAAGNMEHSSRRVMDIVFPFVASANELFGNFSQVDAKATRLSGQIVFSRPALVKSAFSSSRSLTPGTG
jgi:hypothetical protein